MTDGKYTEMLASTATVYAAITDMRTMLADYDGPHADILRSYISEVGTATMRLVTDIAADETKVWEEMRE